ncbi:MAG: hypothetical protein ABIB61_04845 [Candidatus Shapirobacteria bacterium]
MRFKVDKKLIFLIFFGVFVFSLLLSIVVFVRVNGSSRPESFLSIKTTPSLKPTYSNIYDSKKNQSEEEIAQDWVIFEENADFSIKINEAYPDTREVKITIISKATKEEYPVEDRLPAWGVAILSNSDDQRFVLLSCGTYINRAALAIDLIQKKLITSPFTVTTGIKEHLFINSKLVYNSLDPSLELANRFDGSGGRGIAVLDLLTGEHKNLFQPDSLNDYFLREKEGDKIVILHHFVTSVSDWVEEAVINKEEIRRDIAEPLLN